MKSINLSILFAFTILSCTNNDQAQHTIKDALINKMLQSESLAVAKNGKEQLIVATNGFCEEFNCIDYFKEYEQEIIFFSLEDLFMRGMQGYGYVRIRAINKAEKFIDITILTKKEGNTVRIQL